MIDNPITWPHGARCAVAITFDMDSDSILHLAYPDRADTKIATMSFLRYDRIAVPRIIRLYEKYGIKQTFFVPGWCAEHYPETVRAIVESGHEVGHHGYLHENPNTLSAEDEHYWFRRGIEAIEKVTGVCPRGHRSPLYNFSKNTARYLVQAGFAYDSSLMGNEIPYILESGEGSLVELPTDWSMDDWPQYMHNPDLEFSMPVKSPDQAMEVFLAQFDAAWEYGALWVSVWHPFLSGRLARLSRIDKMIEYMMGKGNVWFATLSEIADYVNKVTEDGSFYPLRERTPAYEGVIRELSIKRP